MIPMDYELLLHKYIIHIINCEGTSFLLDEYRHDSDIELFSDNEWKELQRLAKRTDE